MTNPLASAPQIPPEVVLKWGEAINEARNQAWWWLATIMEETWSYLVDLCLADPDKIRAVAEDVWGTQNSASANLKTFVKVAGDLDEQIGRMGNIWRGEAADACIAQLRRYKAAMTSGGVFADKDQFRRLGEVGVSDMPGESLRFQHVGDSLETLAAELEHGLAEIIGELLTWYGVVGGITGLALLPATAAATGAVLGLLLAVLAALVWVLVEQDKTTLAMQGVTSAPELYEMEPNFHAVD